MKNSSYKERPSRGVDPVGLVLSSHPQDAQQPGMHSESQPCPLFYSKTGTGRTGLFLWGAGWLCDWSYLQHGNFMLGNLSFLQSPHGRNLKSHNQKKKKAGLCCSLHFHVCKLEISAMAALCTRSSASISPVKEMGAAGAPSRLLAWRSRYEEQTPALPPHGQQLPCACLCQP